MKNLVISLIIIIVPNFIYPQTFKLGLTADFLTGIKFLNYEFGPAIIVEYRFQNLPIAIQGKTRFYLGELSEENNFSAGYTFSNLSAGINLIYLPVCWDVEPYLGLGIYYNVYDLRQSGNSHLYPGSVYNSTGKFTNNFSFELSIGLKFSATTPINFITEVSRTFNHVGNVNFNSLFLKLGLLFQI